MNNDTNLIERLRTWLASDEAEEAVAAALLEASEEKGRGWLAPFDEQPPEVKKALRREARAALAVVRKRMEEE